MSDSKQLSKLPLHELHSELMAKMVPFAGYEMPIQYRNMGVIKEHLHTREHAALFDVSHMGQVLLHGEHIAENLEHLVPADIVALPVNQSLYTVLTNDSGGMLDDLIITKWASDKLFLVLNAACKKQDIAYLRENLHSSVSIEVLDAQILLALQGPKAREVIAVLAPEAAKLTFMHGCHVSIEGVDCYITCSGYTGEDGFEISTTAESADHIARKLLSFGTVKAVGLGARDSLRLEAGLCLYGHDMDEQTSLVEAALFWCVSKSRRLGGAKEGGFTGADTILRQSLEGVSKKRVGLIVQGPIPVREGTDLLNDKDEKVGYVSSGGFAPTISQSIAMAYLQLPYSEIAKESIAIVRNKRIQVHVSSMPFVPHRYYRG